MNLPEAKDAIIVYPPENWPIEMTGGDSEGERIYLRYGTIFAFKDNPKKEYNIVNFIFHVTGEEYRNMAFFHTPEEAEASGYKSSKNFAEDYACVKQGKDSFECREDGRGE